MPRLISILFGLSWSWLGLADAITCDPSYCNFDFIYEKIFSSPDPDGMSCLDCHADGKNSEGGFDMSTPQIAYDQLVMKDIASKIASTKTEKDLGTPQIRVVPKRPANSYLINVLRRPQSKGGMPEGSYRLSEYWVQVIEQWILLGARPPSTPSKKGGK